MDRVTNGAAASGYRARRFSARDGLDIHFRVYGRASAAVPLLCLAGLTRNAKDYHDLADALASERLVLCPDYRGRGRSGRAHDWRAYSVEAHLSDILHLLAVADVRRIAVLGTSFGGLLAMGLAVLAPTRLAAVILNDIGPAVHPAGQTRIRNYVARPFIPVDWAAAEAHLRALYPDLGIEDAAGWREFARRTYDTDQAGGPRLDYDIAIVRALAGGNEDYDLWRLFDALARVPMMAIRGEHSDVLAAPTLKEMGCRRAGDLDTLTVPDVGHAPFVERPPCGIRIRAFLARIDAAQLGAASPQGDSRSQTPSVAASTGRPR